MMKNYDESVKMNCNRNWPFILDHCYRISIIGGSGSGKTNVILNLIKHQLLAIDKIYLYVKDPFTSNSQFLINSNLGGGGVIAPCWLSLNNSEKVKAVILAFCSIQWHSIRKVHAKFCITYLYQSPDIGQNSELDIKLGTVTKLGKRNKTTSKKIDNDVMLENCDVIDILPIYAQFRAIWKPDSGCIVCETYIFINSNVLSYRNWK